MSSRASIPQGPRLRDCSTRASSWPPLVEGYSGKSPVLPAGAPLPLGPRSKGPQVFMFETEKL